METLEQTDRGLAVKMLGYLAEHTENGGLVMVTLKDSNRNNTKFWLDIKGYYTDEEGQVQILHLSWAYATLLALPTNDRSWVRGSGVGINRALEVQLNLEYLIKRYLDKELQIRCYGNF
jgi:hypothetical protein